MIDFLLLFARETWAVFFEASIYILFGFVAAGAIHCWIPASKIYQFLGKKKFSSILLASITGIPLPLCSCSVVPTALALRKRGASDGATVSFLISTPETSVESIALTYGLMDLPMTIFRPIASLITALIAGVGTLRFGGSEKAREEKKAPVENPVAGQPACCCPDPTGTNSTDILQDKSRSFAQSFFELFDEIAYWLLLGLLLSGLIAAAAPQDWIAKYLGGGTGSMLMILLVSVPLYICASASTPVAAALILKGMSPGAALVFLLAGPATNIGTIMVLWKILGRRILFIYLISIVTVALILGHAVDAFYHVRGMDPQVTMAQPTHLVPHWVMWVGTLVFIALLARSLWRAPVPGEIKTLGRWIGRGIGATRFKIW